MSTKLKTCPHCGGDLRRAAGNMDSREHGWKVRLRLYDLLAPNPDDPMNGADSDEGADPGADGSEIMYGLSNVLTEASALAHDYHGCSLHGMSAEVLARKIRGTRPTLSRNNGRATIRIHYDTRDSYTEGRTKPRYDCRVDVVKMEATSNG